VRIGQLGHPNRSRSLPVRPYATLRIGRLLHRT